MKLAEALILRADRQKRLEQLKQRVVGSAKVQEGDEPPENPQELIAEVERVADELLDLIQRINQTNTLTEVVPGKSLSDTLAERDVLMVRRTIYADLAKAASVVQARTSRSEVKFKSTVSVPDVQKRVDDFSRAYRETDSVIQEMNWKTDLMDSCVVGNCFRRGERSPPTGLSWMVGASGGVERVQSPHPYNSGPSRSPLHGVL